MSNRGAVLRHQLLPLAHSQGVRHEHTGRLVDLNLLVLDLLEAGMHGQFLIRGRRGQPGETPAYSLVVRVDGPFITDKRTLGNTILLVLTGVDVHQLGRGKRGAAKVKSPPPGAP